MSVTDELLANNARYAETFSGPLPLPPSRHIAVVACMDARLNVYGMLGLNEGEAHVIRNAGGVVTDDEIRSLAISQRLLGTREIILIHHTDCGMLTFTDDDFKKSVQDETGIKPAWAAEAFTDLDEDVRQSIARITSSPFVPHTDAVPRLRLRRRDGQAQRGDLSSGGISRGPGGLGRSWRPLTSTSPWPSTAPAGIRRRGASRTPGPATCSPPATGPTSSPRPSAACWTWSRSRTRSGCSRTTLARSAAGSTPCSSRPASLRSPGTSGSCRPRSSPTPSRSTRPRRSPPWTTSAPAAPGCGCGSRTARTRRRSSGGAPSPPGCSTATTRPAAALAELFDEAADYVEVLRRLWDSWEDDAEIRDAATGRFVDREKLHYIDFHGPALLRPRPLDHPAPAAGPAARRRARPPRRRVPPRRPLGRPRLRHPARRRPTPRTSSARSAPSRRPQAGAARPCHVFGDVVVFLDGSAAAAAERKERLDGLLGHEYRSDAHVFVGTPAELADLALEWRAAGLSGLRLRPGGAPARPGTDHPRAGARAAATRRLPYRVRGRHPAGAARPVPPREPLRRLRRSFHAAQADPPGRPLPRRQQHHRLERPGGRQPHRVLLVRALRADRRAGEVRLPVPRRRACGCASRTG